MPKKIRVAKGVNLSSRTLKEMQELPGSSNAGAYKNVDPSDFAGKAGGASPYSFPIDTPARARSALARAHLAPKPAGIRRAVYKKYPELKPKESK